MSTVKSLLMLVLLAALAFGMGVSKGRDIERGVVAQAHLEEVKRIEKERDDVQAELDQTARNWAEDQARSESIAGSTVDRLTESNVRLRVRIADATVSEVEGYNRGVSDGKAELHRETSEALIRLTQDADRQVGALQKIVKEVTSEARQ